MNHTWPSCSVAWCLFQVPSVATLFGKTPFVLQALCYGSQQRVFECA